MGGTPKRYDAPADGLTLNQYQARTELSADYPEVPIYRQLTSAQVLGTLMLAQNAGSVAGKFAEILHSGEGFVTDGDRNDLAKELGRVLYCIARLGVHVGYSLEEIATMNLRSGGK